MIERSIDTTLEICYSIYIRLIDLGYKEYPSNTCKEFIEILKKVNQSIMVNLNQKKEKIAKDVIEEKYRDEYKESIKREITDIKNLLGKDAFKHLTVLQLMQLKNLAIKNNIDDWISLIDISLTYSEIKNTFNDMQICNTDNDLINKINKYDVMQNSYYA